MNRVCCSAAILLSTFIANSARAVILYQNPNRNLRAPTGSFANSGWQWEGNFGDFPATVISKKYIITAAHFGGGVNTPFTYRGVTHRANYSWDDPGSDLKIYEVTGTMNSWAPFYRGNTEVNNSAVIYGRGTQRGDPIFVNNQPKGWQWGTADHRMSWGRNAINSVVDGGDGIGSLLQMTFDEHGPTYEATLSEGDSGGGAFIQTSSGWQLAGVNYGVDSNYSLTKGGTQFRAAVFDRGGLYENGTSFFKDTSTNNPSSIYATRISSRISWIDSVLSGSVAPDVYANPQAVGDGGIAVTPEPTTLVGFTAIAQLFGRPRRKLNRRQLSDQK